MILSFEELQRISKLQQAAAVRRWLGRIGVPFLPDADGDPFTTLDAVNRVLYGARLPESPDFTPPCKPSPRRSTKSMARTTGYTGAAGRD